LLNLSDGGETHTFDDDDDMFFGPKDSLFVFSVTEGTLSPRRHRGAGALKKKYEWRNSGVISCDDEGTGMMSPIRSCVFQVPSKVGPLLSQAGGSSSTSKTSRLVSHL
jgi:hypothetical protein